MERSVIIETERRRGLALTVEESNVTEHVKRIRSFFDRFLYQRPIIHRADFGKYL